MAEKKVKMEIKVDLGCSRCYEKIREVIRKLPEIRDQRYDEKQNRVLISVVSCCPERILEKIASKGGKTVESIKIVPEKKPEEKDGEKKESKTLKETEKKKIVGDEPKEGKTKDARAAGKPEDGKKMKDGGGDKRKGDGKKQQAQGYGAVPYYHGVPAYHGESSYGVNRGL